MEGILRGEGVCEDGSLALLDVDLEDEVVVDVVAKEVEA